MNTSLVCEPRLVPSTLTRVPCLLQWFFLRALRSFKHGGLKLTLPDGTTHRLGAPDAEVTADLHIHERAFFTRAVLFGNVGFGEAYVDSLWDTHDLRALLEWFIINLRHHPHARSSSQRVPGLGWFHLSNRIFHLLRSNSIFNSKRNIQEHYDLGNDFYQLWLDPSMTYSAAKFTHADQSLASAQEAKYEALCQKLRLQPGDRVLEIGCGWGGFSIHAATRYGCHVTGIAISQAQFDEATRRVKAAGLSDLIDIRLQDYRLVTGQFDKVASIEMLEAVGDKYLEPYFAKCDEVLAPNGLLAFQCITVPDNEYADLKRGTDWIQKHIFPGSLLLSLGRVNQAINRTSDLVLHQIEDLGAGYARTLREWWITFNQRLNEVRDLGFDERFIRKWNYYLRYCEAAFATRCISVVQVCCTKPGNASLHREDGVS